MITMGKLRMSKMFKIAAVQMDVKLGAVRANLARMEGKLHETADQGATLTVFPECALSGYCFDSKEEALSVAESVSSASVQRMVEACRERNVHAIFGMLELDEQSLYNTCALIGPTGLLGSYRKIHLPFLGVDRFTSTGNRPFAVHAAGEINVGMNICYDAAFPEAARVLAIEGADLIVLPTNWPPGAESMPKFVVNTRAMENHVYYLAVNRVGTERGFAFIGQSKICDPGGRVIAEAPHQEEAILYAEIDLSRPRNKHVVRVPKLHEIDRFADRHPEMYGPVVEAIQGEKASEDFTRR